jgi:RNA polymerase sigma factor (sigma-70 family)
MQALDPDALGQLYRRHAPALRLFARQWPAAADDLVQDAFVSLAGQRPPPQRIVPWLYRVVRNAALAAQRSARRRRHREESASVAEAWFVAAEDQYDAREAARRLSELPLEVREIVVARLWGGLTFDEVARLVGASLPTVHRRYQAGLLELRERLEGRWLADPKS